uniref:Putative secreted protein n=1 Tax=Anopheles triannulatus TaxID=58253 RepID=A0A2M4B330_9DIPT
MWPQSLSIWFSLLLLAGYNAAHADTDKTAKARTQTHGDHSNLSKRSEQTEYRSNQSIRKLLLLLLYTRTTHRTGHTHARAHFSKQYRGKHLYTPLAVAGRWW